MQPRSAIAPLIPFLEDKDAEVRTEAAMALVDIAGVDALGPLLKNLKIITVWMSLQLSKAVLRMGSAAVKDLIAGINADTASIQGFCIQMLGAIGDISASEPLRDFARFANTDLKCRALIAIGLLGDDSSLPFLLECCRDADPDVRKSAAVALGSLGAADAAATLSEMAATDSVDIRLAAGESLRRLGSVGEQALRTLTRSSDDMGIKVARQFLEDLHPPAIGGLNMAGARHD